MAGSQSEIHPRCPRIGAPTPLLRKAQEVETSAFNLGAKRSLKGTGGPSTKISVMVDALGNLVDFMLLPGQRHDLIGIDPLLDGVAFEALIADRAYDSNALRDELQERHATAVIPPRSNRVDEVDYDREMYKWRHLVENFFCNLKRFRRLAMRFEKTDVSFAAMIHVVSSRLALA